MGPENTMGATSSTTTGSATVATTTSTATTTLDLRLMAMGPAYRDHSN